MKTIHLKSFRSKKVPEDQFFDPRVQHTIFIYFLGLLDKC